MSGSVQIDSAGVAQIQAGIAAVNAGLAAAAFTGAAGQLYTTVLADVTALNAALPDFQATQSAFQQLQKDYASLTSSYAYLLSPTGGLSLVAITQGLQQIASALTRVPGPPLFQGGAKLDNTGASNYTPYGQYGGKLLNQSNIGTSSAKLASIPPTLMEVDGYKRSLSRRNQRTTRVFTCAWSVLPLVEQWLLGYSTNIINPSAPTQGLLSRYPPANDFKEPWKYCTEVDVEGLGQIGSDPDVYVVDSNGNLILDPNGNPQPAPYIAYQEGQGPAGLAADGMARLTTIWEPLPYDILSDASAQTSSLLELSRYVERTKTYAVQAQSIPSTVPVKFTSGPFGPPNAQVVPGNPIQIIPTEQLVLRWIDVPDIPIDAISACIGRVNVNTFNIGPGWPSYTSGQMLMQAPPIDRYWSIIGRISWDIVLRFDIRLNPGGWNSFLAQDGNYYPIAIVPASGPTQLIFKNPTGGLDFPSLFVPPVPVNYQLGQ